MTLLSRILSFAFLASVTVTANSARYWQDVDEAVSLRSDNPIMAKASSARNLDADIASITQQLLNSDNIDIELPLPNGETAIYHLEYSPIAEQGLLDQFPNIRTFTGIDVIDAKNRGRFDISPAGFRAMFRHNGETIFIDPQYVGNSKNYISYKAKDAVPLEVRPADRVVYTDLLDSAQRVGNRALAKGGSDGNLRTYRLAVAATSDYTQFFGGTVADGIAAITTAINRVNEVFQNDLGIRLELIANNNLIVYTDPDTDPYENNFDLGTNQTNIDDVILEANYDIGHVFGIGSGGVASLSSVCRSGSKARGLTGLNNPTGDAFYIDFVAHEIGHQFGANHTFNGTAGSCSGVNRNASTAYEPGSGSTIMAYAGICPTDGSSPNENLQSNSDAYFHAGSIAEITAFVQNSDTGGSCATVSVPVNSTPVANAGVDVTIPANTPFVLTGSATDADLGDTLTYTWEQMDTGSSTSNQAEWVDNGNRTIFRSFEPDASPVRYFPNFLDVLAGSVTPGEAFPTTNRDLNFRFTVRDNSGETAFENKVVSVTANAGPFSVITPGAGDTWTQGNTDVVWDVSGTDSAPVSCTNVNILYSSTGGSSFITLVNNVSNDGSQSVSVPTSATSQARVMVVCSNNVFFAVSDANFQVSTSTIPVLSSVSSPSVNEGGSLRFTVAFSSAILTNLTTNFSLVNATASEADYDSISFSDGVVNNGNGTITIPSGTASFTAIVPTIEDDNVESDETIVLTVDGERGTGTILNDDSNDVATNSGSGGGSSGGASGAAMFFFMSLLLSFRRRWLL